MNIKKTIILTLLILSVPAVNAGLKDRIINFGNQTKNKICNFYNNNKLKTEYALGTAIELGTFTALRKSNINWKTKSVISSLISTAIFYNFFKRNPSKFENPIGNKKKLVNGTGLLVIYMYAIKIYAQCVMHLALDLRQQNQRWQQFNQQWIQQQAQWWMQLRQQEPPSAEQEEPSSQAHQPKKPGASA